MRTIMKSERQVEGGFKTVSYTHLDVYKRQDGYNRRFGLYSNKNGEILNRATSVLDWGIFYEKIIQQILDGTWKRVSDKETVSRNYWWGLSAGVESLICSSQMPYGTKRLVNTFQNLIIEGSFHPFEGVFYDKNGKEYGKKDTILSNEEIITMDWLFSNIVGEIPACLLYTSAVFIPVRRPAQYPKKYPRPL